MNTMTPTTDLYRLESKVDALTTAINRLVLFEERQAVQALAIIENTKSIQNLEVKLEGRMEITEVKLAMWINRGLGMWSVVTIAGAIISVLISAKVIHI